MKKLNMIALVCAMGCMSYQARAVERQTITDRFNETKETLVKKASALFVLWGDSSLDAQKKRLAVYQWVEQKDWWMRHPKKWMTWIATGSMPVKLPDNRVTDAEYINYYLVYKSLILDRSLTDEEVYAARIEAMDLLKAYRKAKGIH